MKDKASRTRKITGALADMQAKAKKLHEDLDKLERQNPAPQDGRGGRLLRAEGLPMFSRPVYVPDSESVPVTQAQAVTGNPKLLKAHKPKWYEQWCELGDNDAPEASAASFARQTTQARDRRLTTYLVR
jgi:hypothetical protein